MKKYYSGKKSCKFWDKINKINSDELHDMAIELQVLEEKVLNEIDNIIEENKPCFSKKQINEAISSVSLSEFLWNTKLIEILGL